MNTRQNPQQKIIVSALVGLLVIGLAAVAVAQGPGQGRGQGGRGGFGGGGFGDGDFGPEMRMERMTQHLDLTEDQVKAITEIRENGRVENQELRKQIMRLRHDKRGEMLKDDPAAKTVLELTTKIGDRRTELQTNRMSNLLEVRKVLTPDQRDKMLLHSEQRGGRDGHRMGFRKGGQGNSGRDGWGQHGNGSGRGNW